MSYQTIDFVKQRDGDKAAVAFAKQGMIAYRAQALKYGLRSLVNGGAVLEAYKQHKAYYIKHKDK